MHQAVDADRWSSILKEITRILKPDGWIEWVEPDSEIHRSGPITKEFNHQMVQLMEHHQQDSSLGKCLQEKLKDTNQFENISSMFVSCPGGKWAGQVIYKYYFIFSCSLIMMG
jgi:ubiquinone/menaquinone biosynthesis C-methylase UbiE